VRTGLRPADFISESTDGIANTSSERTALSLSPAELIDRVNGLRVLMMDLGIAVAGFTRKLTSLQTEKNSGDGAPAMIFSLHEIDDILTRAARIYARANAVLSFEGLVHGTRDELQSSRVQSCFDRCRTLFRLTVHETDGAEEREGIAAELCQRPLHRAALNVVETLQIAEEHFAAKFNLSSLPPIPQ
jgi:hypothetical protein